MSEIEEIVRGLTKGERSGIYALRPGSVTAYSFMQGQIRVSLFRKGIVERATDFEDEDDAPLFRLTETGNAVREALLRKDHP